MKTQRIYIEVSTQERLPEKGGYYDIVTDRIVPHVHWSIENQIWTLEDGEKWESTYPNSWLELSETSQLASLQSLIERVENEAYNVTTQSGDGLIIVELDDVLNILKSTPVISAKALRMKGTDEWYNFIYQPNHSYFSLSNIPIGYTDESLDAMLDYVELPPYAELIEIEILLP